MVIMELEKVNQYETMRFIAWFKGRYNTLETAQILSKTLFNKPYSELFTYEHNYIIQQIAKGTQPLNNNIFNGGF